MKRLSLIALALVACLAIGSVTMAVAGQSQAKKVKTKVTLSYTPSQTGPYGEQASFNGKVKAKKVCRKGRKVSVKNVGTGAIVGKTKTNKKGKYSISAGSGAAPGTYQAKVKKKTKKKKNGTKIVCKRAKSNKVTVS